MDALFQRNHSAGLEVPTAHCESQSKSPRDSKEEED